MLENGDVLRVTESGSLVGERVSIPRRCLGLGLSGDLSDELLVERHRLGRYGVVSPIVFVSASTGKWARPCELVTRGFLDQTPGEPIAAEIRDIVNATVRNHAAGASTHGLRATIEIDVNRLLKRRFRLRPLVAPILVEV